METLSNLAFGLEVALSWQNILYCFIGCFLGTLVGVLPGIGPVATVAMLLPFTFGLGPAPALIMLAGIYYGAQYGGSTTAILVNIPGESSSVVTGPIPGSTPTTVPSSTPTKQYSRFCSVSATPNPIDML